MIEGVEVEFRMCVSGACRGRCEQFEKHVRISATYWGEY